jgi:AmiR/NasT family two-component response regulator
MSTGSRRNRSREQPRLDRLRVLVANEDLQRLELIVSLAEAIDQQVVAREVEVTGLADRAREILPDVAVVGLHDHHTDHALAMIEEIVGEGICPVVAIIEGNDPDFVSRAAQSGIFAYVSSLDEDALRGAFDVALRRFGQAEELEGALARRAVIERAKGVLMERYGIDDRAAFERLRDQSQRTGEKLLVIAQALLNSHPLMREPARDQPAAS